MPPHKTTAWPLGLAYGVLVVYASLYPFGEWRDQGPLPWGFLLAPWPQYWTAFDIVANIAGYVPLGFLLALTALRTGQGRQAILRATLGAAGLSLLMETLQGYLPARVPSNVDLVLNVAGAWFGAALASLMEWQGAIGRWSRFRARWFVPDARGGLVLLALWPFALLFPAAVPFGLGQVFERVESALAELLSNTPFLEWLPMREIELQPMVPMSEMTCVLLGILIPCLLGYSIVPAPARRAVYLATLFAAGVGATLLSAILSYGPAHAWTWLSLPVQVGLGVAAVLAVLFLRLPERVCAGLMLLLLGLYLMLINHAPASPYFAHTLQIWEQGRFIRFHGVSQWLGWCWPYAVLLYALTRIWGQTADDEEPPKIQP